MTANQVVKPSSMSRYFSETMAGTQSNKHGTVKSLKISAQFYLGKMTEHLTYTEQKKLKLFLSMLKNAHLMKLPQQIDESTSKML